MYMIEIKESKFDELAENAERMLHYGGKVMSCLDGMRRDGGRMGERSPMRDYRDIDRDDDFDDDSRYGERRGGYRGRRY
jgi:hypothetical protein